MRYDFDILAIGFLIPIILDLAWAAAIAYGASLIAGMFTKEPGGRAAKVGGYPIQYSQKGVCIPKVYGCERVAGNLIWLGTQGWYEKKTRQPHTKGKVRVGTYFRSFLIGIAEGNGTITKIWMGDRLLWSLSGGSTENTDGNEQTRSFAPAPIADPGGTPAGGSVWLSSGNGTQDARFFTGEAFGKYDNLIWAYFEGWENLPGTGPTVPSFAFEVCTATGYKYTYISEANQIWGIPNFGPEIQGLDVDGVSIDLGGGDISLPMKGHPYLTGDVVTISNTTTYNGTHTLIAGTTADRLHMTTGFGAETFDGTERVVKFIGSLGGGAGHMTQDRAGNLYYLHEWANNTHVTKIAVDNTITYDTLNMVHNYNTPVSIKFSADESAVFIYFNAGKRLEKYIMATGNLDWGVATGDIGSYDMSIDSNDNCYLACDSNAIHGLGGQADIAVFEPVAGAKTQLAGVGGLYDTDVNNTSGLVLGAGADQDTTPAPNLKNLFVATLDGSSLVSMAVGGLHVIGGRDHTFIIGTGMALIHNGFVYVLSHTPTSTLYKIQVSRGLADPVTGIQSVTGLTIVEEVAGPTYGQGLFIDFSGNICVINTDTVAVVTDIMYFYDGNLNFIGKIDDFEVGMLDNWSSGVGSSWSSGDSAFFPGIGADDTQDENPARIIDDLARNTRYGAGIASTYINSASILEELAYWAGRDNEISLALTEQRPMMDWIDFVLSHCNGFRFWSEGQFHIGAFKDEASVASLTTDDLIRDEGEDPPPPVSINKRKMTETFNRAEIEWVDRENTYDLAVAMEQDEVDQRVSGKVRIDVSDLTGIHTAPLAGRTALTRLFESMYRFSIYSFKVGYKRMLLTVGDVIDVTDGYFLTAQKMRIISREEDKDGRNIAIEAAEDIAGMYPELAESPQRTLHAPDTKISPDDLVTGILAFREHITAANLYISFAPRDIYTDGADLYRSYDGINYEFVTRTVFDKTTPNSVGTLTTSLSRAKAVMHRYDEQFTVDIGEVTSLRTDVSDDDFFSNQNLAKIGDEVIAWKDATDLGSGIWRINQVIRGMFGTEAIEHPIGAVFATLSPIDFYYFFTDEVAGQKLYFKALATHESWVSQALANVAATEYTVIREHLRPAPISIQRIKDSGGFYIVQSFPVVISFNLASKGSGYNRGGMGEGGWGNFTKDDRIVGINITLKTLTGTQIAFEYHDLAGYHADDYELTITEADRLGNDPVIVVLEPVTSLPASKPTANMIDLV